MSKQENQETKTPEKSTEFVHLPKSVHKENIYHLLGYEIVLERMTRFTGHSPYSKSQKGMFEIVISLLGYNYYSLPDKLTDRLSDIISRNTDDVINVGTVNIPQIGKKVYKAWKAELKYYNHNSSTYEA